MPAKANTVEKFWALVDKSGECWLWLGRRDPHGYGIFKLGPKVRRAHRLAWILTHGEIPDGLNACHNCPDGDNPSCVNPAHLFLGTHTDNVADRVQKGRSATGDRSGAHTHPEAHPRGERSGNARLTESEVLEIRRQYAAREATQVALAAAYSVHQTTISLIVKRRNWHHLD